MHKKLIFLGLFLTLTFPIALPVQAQTFSVEQESQMKAIIQQITDLQIQILLATIADLQAQIVALLANQATQAIQLGAVSSKVDTVISQTVPIIAPVAPPLSISLGTPYCDIDPTTGRVWIPVVISGSQWKYASGLTEPTTFSLDIGGYRVAPQGTKYFNKHFTQGGASFMNTAHPEAYVIAVGNNWGETKVKLILGTEPDHPTSSVPIPTYTFTDTIVVGDVCQ